MVDGFEYDGRVYEPPLDDVPLFLPPLDVLPPYEGVVFLSGILFRLGATFWLLRGCCVAPLNRVAPSVRPPVPTEPPGL